MTQDAPYEQTPDFRSRIDSLKDRYFSRHEDDGSLSKRERMKLWAKRFRRWVPYLFVLFAAYKGIAAAATYADSDPLFIIGQVIGVAVVSLTLLSIDYQYDAGAVSESERIPVLVSFIVLLTLESLNIATSSIIHDPGHRFYTFASWYMSSAFLLVPTVGLSCRMWMQSASPETRTHAEQDRMQREFALAEFEAEIAQQEGVLESKKAAWAMQLEAMSEIAAEMLHYYESDEVKQYIKQAAFAKLPDLLADIGVALPSPEERPYPAAPLSTPDIAVSNRLSLLHVCLNLYRQGQTQAQVYGWLVERLADFEEYNEELLRGIAEQAYALYWNETHLPTASNEPITEGSALSANGADPNA